MAPPARVSVGCGELGSAKPPGPRMSRQISTSTCVTAPNSPDLMRRRISCGAWFNR